MLRPALRYLRCSTSHSRPLSGLQQASLQYQPSRFSFRQGPDQSGPADTLEPTEDSESAFRKHPATGSSLPFAEESSQDYSMQTYTQMVGPAFSEGIGSILTSPVSAEDIEIKPDGVIYLPEIRYRKILFRAFGPGGWCLVPKGPHSLNAAVLSREYALLCHGRFIAQARGSLTIASFSNPGLASEGVRSNALMRCCKDLGIAAELWDPAYIADWKSKYAAKKQDFKGKWIWLKKDS